MPRSFRQLSAMALYTVWPLLERLEQLVESKFVELSKSMQAAAPQGTVSVGASQPYLETKNFSLFNATSTQYVNGLDATALLADAMILFRADGGEVLVKFTLSSGTLDHHSPLIVTLMKTTAARTSATSFSPSITLSVVEGAGASISMSALGQLNAGDCVIALAGSDWTEIRVDGTLKIQRG